jgi:hypothetical protein
MAANQVIEVDFRSRQVIRRREVLSAADIPVLELPVDWRDHLSHSFACQMKRELFREQNCVCSHEMLLQQLSRLERLAELTD